MDLRLTARRAARRSAAVVTVVATVAATFAIVGPGAGAGAARMPRYAAPGPFAAGVTTLDLPDRKVEVWYPAKPKSAAGAVPASFELVERVPAGIAALLPPGAAVVVETDAFRDLPAARRRGGFPLVLMAHGTAGYREQLHYLATHLASWGFVVASPDILERGLGALLGAPPAVPIDDITTMRAVEALLRSEHTRPDGPLAGRVRPDGVAITGQSAGGSTALRFADEPGVVAAVPLSAGRADPRAEAVGPLPDIPVMFVTGGADGIVPVDGVEAAFEAAPGPARLVVVEAAGHASVAGICPIGGPGGLVGLAEANRLPVPDGIKRLAADGCTDPAPDPDPAWAPIDHAVTAQLRAAFGLDRSPRGLDQRTFDRFAPVAVRYRERR